MKIILTIFLYITISCNDNSNLSIEIRSVADDLNFPYAKVLEKAKAGDLSSIEVMARFYEKTDAGSSFSHSKNMYEILRAVGDEEFYHALSTQNKKTIKLNLDWLQDRNHNLYQVYPKLKKLKQ